MINYDFLSLMCLFFFFNDTPTTEIYTLSLHDALPISTAVPKYSAGSRMKRHADAGRADDRLATGEDAAHLIADVVQDRKSTRLNSSHSQISYAVFCLKKKKKINLHTSHNV